MAFTSDGSKLVTVELSDVHLWKVATGERERTWRLPQELRKLAISPDGKTVAVTYWGNSARVSIWLLNLETGDSKVIHPGVFGEEVLAFSPDSHRLAIGFDKRAMILDLRTNTVTHLLHRDALAVKVDFNTDGSRLLVSWISKDDNQIQVWDATEPKAKKLPIEPKSPEFALDPTRGRRAAFLPDGRIAAWRMEDKAFKFGVWTADGKPEKSTVAVPDFPGSSVVQSVGENKFIIATEFQGHAKACEVDLVTEKVNTTYDWTVASPEHPRVALSHDGKFLAVASKPGFQVNLYDLGQNKLIRRLGQPDPIPVIVGFGPDNRSIAWGYRQTLWPSAASDLAAGLNLATLQPMRRGSFKEFALWRNTPPGFKWEEKRLNDKPGTAFTYKGKRVESDIGHGRASTVYVTPKGKLGLVVAGGAGGLIHIDGSTGEVLSYFGSRGLLADQLVVSPDGRYLLVARGNLALDLYRIDREPELLLNVMTIGPDWIAWTPQGYYAGTRGLDRSIGWKIERANGKTAEFYPIGQFQKAFYRPDVISRVLEKGNVAEAVLAANNALVAQKIDIPQGGAIALDKMLPPGVTLTLVEETDKPKFKIKVTANQGSPEQPIKSVVLYVDGRRLPNGQAAETFGPGLEKASFDRTWSIELSPGKHKLEAIARSKDDSPSVSNRIEVKCPQALEERPTLRHVAVGVSKYADPAIKDLKFAASDAEHLSEAFAQSTKRGNFYKEAVSTKLLDGDATRTKVLEAIETVRGSAQPNDLFVLSFAGHGLREGGEVFLLTRGANPANAVALQPTAISGKVLREKLTNFPCQVLLLLDSCHAGQIGAARSGSDEAARMVSDVDTRVTVICAALGHEEALAEKDGGLFSMAIVRALLKERDTVYNHETGEMNVYDLMAYVYREVYTASEEKQTPYLKMPLAQPAFTLAQFEKK